MAIELQDARDQNELLEFRCLELEASVDVSPPTPDDSPSPDLFDPRDAFAKVRVRRIDRWR